MSARLSSLACAIGAASLLGGCATLGGNVEGNFACRAPEGTCAPTSLIDAQATGLTAAQETQPITAAPSVPSTGRSLRIVLAAHRDEAGREHEARVVHVVLPAPAAEGWRQPSGTGELLRAIGQAVARAPEPDSPAENSNLPELPDQLFLPSQPGPAIPGAHAPEPGAPGRNASPGRVPPSLTEPTQEQGDEQ
jgi:conjugal transfer pilus assembly protein TraV